MKKILSALLLIVISCSSLPTSETKKDNIHYKETALELYSKALLLKNEKKYTEAIALLAKASENTEQRDAIYYQMAECYFYQYNYEKAIEYADKAIAANDSFDKPYILQYSVYMNLNQAEDATQVLEKLLIKRPQLYRIRFNLASVYYSQTKQNLKARYHFLKIIEQSQYETIESYYKEQSYYFLGHIYYGFGEYKKAYQFFLKAYNENPDNYSILYILGLLNLEKGDIKQATVYLSQYLERYPNDIKAILHLGRIYYIYEDMKALPVLRKAINHKSSEGTLAKMMYTEMLHNDDKALELAQKLRRMNSSLDMPYIALARIAMRNNDSSTAATNYYTAGVLLYQKHHYDAAISMFVNALHSDAAIHDAYVYLGQIYEDTNQLQLAIYYYTMAYKLKKNNDIMIRIGYIYTLLKDYTRAFEYFTMATSPDHTNPDVYFFKGLALLQKSDYANAGDMFRKALKIKRAEPYYFYLASALDKQKKIHDTISVLQEAYNNDMKSARICNYLGYLYADNNMRLEESLVLINTALENEPTNGAYLDSLGWVYFKMGKYNDALPILIEASVELEMEGYPDAVVYEHIGDTYKALQLHDKALEYWNKAYALDPRSDIQKKINAQH
ncbi:MAG TPA: tetratricopeptide repeat protein [Spirochaetota bacterium]|nr:tetratricopeptide repeat protein [Spirochaetota bacterium]HQK06256.1 tetratricopeptide repeat protein [Spirochaetota bacterium]